MKYTESDMSKLSILPRSWAIHNSLMVKPEYIVKYYSILIRMNCYNCYNLIVQIKNNHK